eukprot:CFRG0837T1
MDPFILDGLRKMVISEFGEVAGAIVDADAERRKKASVIESLVTPMALTRCYMRATRDFLGVKTDENVLELVGEYWSTEILEGDSWPDKPPIEVIADALKEINRVHTILNHKYTGQAHFPLFNLQDKFKGVQAERAPTHKFKSTSKSMQTPTETPTPAQTPCQSDSASYTVTIGTGMYEHRVPTCVGMIKGVLRIVCPWAEATSAGNDIVIKFRRRSTPPSASASQFSVSGPDVNLLFPYHVAFDYRMRIVQTGTKLESLCAIPLDSLIFNQFDIPLVRPEKKLSENMDCLIKNDGRLVIIKRKCKNSFIVLHGQIHHFEQYGLFVFLGTPTAETLYDNHASLLDLPVFNRVCGIPFNYFNVTEVDIEHPSEKHLNENPAPNNDITPGTTSTPTKANTDTLTSSSSNHLPSKSGVRGEANTTDSQIETNTQIDDIITTPTSVTTPIRQIGYEADGVLSPGFLPVPSRRTLLRIKRGKGVDGIDSPNGSATSLSQMTSGRVSPNGNMGDIVGKAEWMDTSQDIDDDMHQKIKVYRRTHENEVPVDPNQLDLSTPVQKFYSALQLLRLNLPPEYRKQVDEITSHLSHSYDVYLPSSPSTNVKDKEIRSYMESFFPTQAGLKFDQQARAGLNRTLSLVGRAGSPKAGYKQNTRLYKRGSSKTQQPVYSDPACESPEDQLIQIEGDGKTSSTTVSTIPTLPRLSNMNRGKARAKSVEFVNRNLGSITDYILAGFLNKESSVNMRSWRKRFFVLEQEYLTYFRDKSPSATPLAVVDLAEYETIKRVTRKSATCIELSNGNVGSQNANGPGARKYYMYADKEEENQKWLDAFADTLAENKMKRMQWGPLQNVQESSSAEALFKEPVAYNEYYRHGRSRSIVETEDIRIDIPRRLSQPQFGWLRHLGDLNFDVFEVANKTNDRPLQFVGKAILQNTGLSEKFNIPEDKLDRFLRYIGKGYHKENPYHNEYHATDVTQTVYHFLYTLGLAQYFGDREALAAIVAAMIHDFQHPGVNNAYLVNSRSAEALLYNDHSVLENMHLTKAFQVISNSDCNIFCNLSTEDYAHVRTLIIQMVLNTDMSYHFELMGKFKSAVTVLRAEASEEVPNKTIMLILAMAVHCADVSNPCKRKDIYGAWAKRVMEEFWDQGDKEAAANMPISPMCDRNTVTIEKCQSSFIQLIVEPLYKTFSILMPELHEECIPNLQGNKEYWLSKLAVLESSQGGGTEVAMFTQDDPPAKEDMFTSTSTLPHEDKATP